MDLSDFRESGHDTGSLRNGSVLAWVRDYMVLSN